MLMLQPSFCLPRSAGFFFFRRRDFSRTAMPRVASVAAASHHSQNLLFTLASHSPMSLFKRLSDRLRAPEPVPAAQPQARTRRRSSGVSLDP